MSLTWGILFLLVSFFLSGFGVFLMASRILHPQEPWPRTMIVIGYAITVLVIVLSFADGDARLATPWVLASPLCGIVAGILLGTRMRKQIDPSA